MSSETIVDNSSHRHCHDYSINHSLSQEPIIRGNLQYINGELKKIPRPLNAFMIFSNEKRKELKKEYPGEPNNMISSRLGQAWKALSDETRKRYHDLAHREDLEHRRKYPNYQYCPGHARKLKKARREQRLRQQSSSYRASRQQVKNQLTQEAHVKRELENEANTPESYSQPQQIVHGIIEQANSTPGPQGEGQYTSSSGPVPSSDNAVSCYCKPGEMYCCQETHWGPESFPPTLSYSHHFSQSLVYMPYDAQYGPADKLTWSHSSDVIHQQCLFSSGECVGCYPNNTYIDTCCGPPLGPQMYPGGDANVVYKDLCFVPPELAMPTPNNVATPVSAVESAPSLDQERELTDISNNMVQIPQTEEIEATCDVSMTCSPDEVPIACKEETIQ